MVEKGRKSTQRERLLEGMVEIANRRGYTSATVSAVIERAGVSRPTFYEYFEDRDDCFLASIADAQEQLAERVRGAIEERPPEEGAAGALDAIVAFASTEPARARLLMSEAMAGGVQALDARDRGITELAALVDGRAGTSAAIPDLDPRVAIGGIYRVLGTRLRRREPAISKLTGELLEWIGSYSQPAGAQRWRTLAPSPPAPPSPYVPDVPIQQLPGVLPPGRPRISEEEVAENHRLRILYAVARLAESKGYTATTVADIAKLAQVDGSVFYRLFADKRDAFMSVHELGFQQVMDVTTKAFFAGRTWPERSWEAGRALTQLLEENPLVAHVGFVEAYAVGSAAVQRIEDSHTAFTFFLQEGLVHSPPAAPPSRLAMEAIVASIFEVIYLQARHAETPRVTTMLGQIANLWLAPFLGCEESNRFIDSHLLDRDAT